jgi:hypothetical protein
MAAESGTPPGRFLGSGLADLDGGRGVGPGTEVTEEHLRLMLVALSDPVSGEPLGGAPHAPAGKVPVAAFDICFNLSKSISVAWALADAETKAVIYDCHLEAIDYVLSYAERHVFCSRSGKNGIVEEDVTGVVATAVTHFASRADDPQTHRVLHGVRFASPDERVAVAERVTEFGASGAAGRSTPELCRSGDQGAR